MKTHLKCLVLSLTVLFLSKITMLDLWRLPLFCHMISIQLSKFIYFCYVFFVFCKVCLRNDPTAIFSTFSFSGKRRSFEDRSFKPQIDHRSQTLQTIEKYLNRMGGVVGNGHACVLRAICEVNHLNY